MSGPFLAWAAASVLLVLGFTFFSGATEAWLVDGSSATGYEGSLESAFARGQIATGAAMLTGTIAGGVLAHLLNPPVCWLMLAAPFSAGVSIYGFYAAQPYLLELYGDSEAYVVAALSMVPVRQAYLNGLIPSAQRPQCSRRTTF